MFKREKNDLPPSIGIFEIMGIVFVLALLIYAYVSTRYTAETINDSPMQDEQQDHMQGWPKPAPSDTLAKEIPIPPDN